MIESLFIYITIQWFCSLFLSYSIKVPSFAFSQLKTMRRISLYSVIGISILSIAGYLHFLDASIFAYLIAPIAIGLIIISVFYSTLTMMFIYNTTHQLKGGNNQFLRLLSLFILPIGIFTLKVSDEYQRIKSCNSKIEND